MTREEAPIGLKQVCPDPVEAPPADTILKMIHTVQTNDKVPEETETNQMYLAKNVELNFDSNILFNDNFFNQTISCEKTASRQEAVFYGFF